MTEFSTLPPAIHNHVAKDVIPGHDAEKLNQAVDRTVQIAARASEVSQQILEIILQYSLNKFNHSADKLALGVPLFLSVISGFVVEEKRIKMVLPSFPFKSANKVYKVLGFLPDKAEELSLERLNTMCERIAEIYTPGATLTIVSDGLVYNDLLCIPDKDVWAYGQAIRAMAVEKGFTHVEFSRIRDLVSFPLPQQLEEITYVANATNFRCYMLNKHGKPNLDVDAEIANNMDTLMTYRGYSRFLHSDLQHAFHSKKSLGANEYRRNVKFLAKEMLRRGYAFAEAIEKTYPDCLRLSIHESTGANKVSISLLNTKSGYTTPWHCSVALLETGEWLSAPMGEFLDDETLEVVEENGRPSYFRSKLLNANDQA
ncbi:hypothetical protein EsDP_00006461 [Epichloe bromicola]|uniref:Pyoverdine biosynthesis n=1 Tax=Epichloe bromicola TaxID=79588 RepID=A0ABQ0CXP5_9HYPO